VKLNNTWIYLKSFASFVTLFSTHTPSRMQEWYKADSFSFP